MDRFITSRMSLWLLSAVLVAFSLTPNLPASTQDKDSCRADQEGWTTIDGTQINLSGTWSVVQNTNCQNKWQYSGTVTISKDGDQYSAKFDDGTPADVHLRSSGIVFVRDLRDGAGKDKDGAVLQTWTGKIQRHEDDRLRIYGQRRGAWDYMTWEGFNRDFKMIKQ